MSNEESFGFKVYFCNKFILEVFHNISFNSTELTVQRRTTCNDFETKILSSTIIILKI